MTTEEIEAAIKAAERMPENMALHWLFNHDCRLHEGCNLQEKLDYG